MLPGLRVALAAASLACSVAADAAPGFARWDGSGFASAEIRHLSEREVYPAGSPALPHRFDMTVLFEHRTPWTQARALRQIRKTAVIFKACGIALGNVALVRLALRPEDRGVDTALADPASGVPPTVVRLASKLPLDTAYPAAFLIGKVKGTESLAISYRSGDERGPDAAYFNTAWISYQSHWLPRRDDNYSALAHELAHLLCRCGHTRTAERHLLHGARNFLSSEVRSDECERFRTSPMLTVND